MAKLTTVNLLKYLICERYIGNGIRSKSGQPRILRHYVLGHVRFRRVLAHDPTHFALVRKGRAGRALETRQANRFHFDLIVVRLHHPVVLTSVRSHRAGILSENFKGLVECV